jgi:Ala-tRNA(Pro) deacylase
MCIRDYLQSRHVWFEMLLHRPASTASRLASSVHVSGRLVAKAVLVRVDDRYVLAVLPAASRIDPARLEQVVGDQSVRLATEDEVAAVFSDCERGAVPPFGRLYGLRTVVEVSLAERPEFLCVGNQRHEGVRMHFADFEAIEAPLRARFAVAPLSPRQRRAG